MEVDYNVIWNIVGEFKNDDWSFMVFYYFGLDYIGYKVGLWR